MEETSSDLHPGTVFFYLFWGVAASFPAQFAQSLPARSPRSAPCQSALVTGFWAAPGNVGSSPTKMGDVKFAMESLTCNTWRFWESWIRSGNPIWQRVAHLHMVHLPAVYLYQRLAWTSEWTQNKRATFPIANGDLPFFSTSSLWGDSPAEAEFGAGGWGWHGFVGFHRWMTKRGSFALAEETLSLAAQISWTKRASLLGRMDLGHPRGQNTEVFQHVLGTSNELGGFSWTCHVGCAGLDEQGLRSWSGSFLGLGVPPFWVSPWII